MRIAYIYDAVYPFVKGGVEKRVYEIGTRLSKKHEVHWISLDWGGNIPSIKLQKVGRGVSLYSGQRRSIREALYFSAKVLLKAKWDYDIIDCQQFPYLPCFSSKVHSILRNVPMVITWHEIWKEYWKKYLGNMGAIGIQIEKLMSRLTSHHVSVSKLTQKRLRSIGIDSALIPNGIDFKRIQRVKKLPQEYDVIFVGRLIKEKNVDLLLRAIKLIKDDVPDLKVLIIGEGPEKYRLLTLVSKLELTENVKFISFLNDYEKLIAYLKSSKVFVLPSKREGFGIIVLEANASGVPVITLDYPLNASRDLITHGYNGFISPPNPSSLAEYIELSLSLGKKFKRNCIKNARRYDWDNITQLTERLYERVLYGS
ncbi:glycosyltransferase family 4 protein [Pyrococcus abyssi]|uniref:LPS biosynthesis RfbU related protein n=1 Tax=Pyrococcus abyssi (strain GE5 / Orsay) TaxID=272844 RepID=Q9UYP8_PYRAB|nr:glycosyltransferase family 4 protein [Pyrococcus abyssi]CAB50364.1 lps biosynthesis rfbU related protein [Pyrococcus abyssi GE5]CCE70905.1 TPA: LPS biosynthesis rfbu related protein [Pyrococcus abyssi GE5]